MRVNKFWLFLPAAIFLLTSGCAPLVVGGAAIGAGAGTYFYIDGELQAEFGASFDKVWSACEKTMADMRAVDVQPFKEIGSGRITAVINDEKVKFTVKYKTKNQTTVSIRVGVLGNKTASQLLHDKISDNIFGT